MNASVTGLNALSIGYSSVGDSQDAVAIGSSAYSGGVGNVAIGKEAAVTSTADGSFLLGNGTTATGANTFVLGNNIAEVTGTNSVVLGSGSDGSQNNAISVGSKGKERKIVNVAQGIADTDAVNVSQMKQSIKDGGGGDGGLNLVTQDVPSNDIMVAKTSTGNHVNFTNGANAARELINVAAGTTATSAVNLAQLKPVVDALGGGAKVDATTGAVTGPTYTIQKADKHTVGEA
ncbi:hypothetical protein [Caballeronia sp. 15711]|uniref:hypothetical protein n=1 Tax=Caballeronia sp. 15711 TaxID=3391029 RepID=UPI0039E3491E